MGKKEIFVEEAILDEISRGMGSVERPLSERAFFAFFVLAIIFFLIIFSKITLMNIANGGTYKEMALANSGEKITEQAPRGIIYDRFGNPLVKNKPSFYAYINLAEIYKHPEKIKEEIGEISEILKVNSDEITKKVLSANLERQSSIPIADNISLEEISKLRSLDKKWIIIGKSFYREYINGEKFSHIIGYTGFASDEDIKNNKDLTLNDRVGKEGIESFYDEILRGIKGNEIIYRDSKGKEIERKSAGKAIAGSDLYTTIDFELQKYFYEVFSEQLKTLNREKGAGVILNPNTGEVLSLISFPSYDNNNLNSKIFLDKDKPTFNRVVSGLYSPGSTIKPLVGIAALSENVVTPNTLIYSPGYIEVPNPYNPDKPSRFVDWRPQGWVNIYSAIAKSSNVYFYEVGGGFEDQKGIGIAKLKEYWKKFLLDEKTGIDLPGENMGILPDPEWKEKRTGDFWRLGDTYNVSIGQGDFMITPIELIRYITSIPNRGEMPVPFIVNRSTNTNSNNIGFIRKPKFEMVDVKGKNSFEIVEKGMIDAVEKSYGTSHMLSTIPMKIAAKTGSAQIFNNTKTNAFFVGYNIPDDRLEMNRERILLESGDTSYIPQQIAVLILVEDAKEGSLNAVPIAKKVFEWYYNNRLNINAEKTDDRKK